MIFCQMDPVPPCCESRRSRKKIQSSLVRTTVRTIDYARGLGKRFGQFRAVKVEFTILTDFKVSSIFFCVATDKSLRFKGPQLLLFLLDPSKEPDIFTTTSIRLENMLYLYPAFISAGLTQFREANRKNSEL